MFYGYVFPLSLGKYAGNWVTHGEKWKSAGRDGIAEMISLQSIIILMLCLVEDEDERTKFLMMSAGCSCLWQASGRN